MDYGLPLQLLRLEPEHEVAVIEMGMSAAGEIAALCHIAAPDWGVVTNVGHAHTEFFADGIAGVARAKYELVAALPRNGVAFLNCDDPYVSQFGRDFAGQGRLLRARALRRSARETHVEALGADGTHVCRCGPAISTAELHLHLPGEHNASNALAAIAVGVEAGIPLADCCAALEELRPEDKRGQVLMMRGATIINDCYNSNPEALKSMIADAGERAGAAADSGCGRDAGAGTGSRGTARGVRQGRSAGGDQHRDRRARQRAAHRRCGASRRRGRRCLWRRRRRRARGCATNLRARRCGAAEGLARSAAGART